MIEARIASSSPSSPVANFVQDGVAVVTPRIVRDCNDINMELMRRSLAIRRRALAMSDAATEAQVQPSMMDATGVAANGPAVATATAAAAAS